MAKKQKDYLADLLAEERDELSEVTAAAAQTGQPSAGEPTANPPREHPAAGPPRQNDERQQRSRGTTLLGRESALARLASGEVRQVTQLLLDPARVRIWPGNARSYEHLTEQSCCELIDSIIAEGGQKVPAIVRRLQGDPDHEYEVIAGTRRHWSISWLRAHSYPDMQFLAQVAQLDDEAAFRLADLENRARKDVSDLERARNYAAALKTHYDNHLTRMAERLKLSKGWLSKMLKVASIPDEVIAAFVSPGDVQLKPAYSLAQALDDQQRAKAILREATVIAGEQRVCRKAGEPGFGFQLVLARLMDAGTRRRKTEPLVIEGEFGRPAVTVRSANRQGVTLRLHSGHGLSEQELIDRVRAALLALDDEGRGLQK